jgi:hypothetical protein
LSISHSPFSSQCFLFFVVINGRRFEVVLNSQYRIWAATFWKKLPCFREGDGSFHKKPRRFLHCNYRRTLSNFMNLFFQKRLYFGLFFFSLYSFHFCFDSLICQFNIFHFVVITYKRSSRP